jgi:hypothetical protein
MVLAIFIFPYEFQITNKAGIGIIITQMPNYLSQQYEIVNYNATTRVRLPRAINLRAAVLVQSKPAVRRPSRM